MSLCICTSKTSEYTEDIQLAILKKSKEEKRKKDKIEKEYRKKYLKHIKVYIQLTSFNNVIYNVKGILDI